MRRTWVENRAQMLVGVQLATEAHQRLHREAHAHQVQRQSGFAYLRRVLGARLAAVIERVAA
jgi:hypothetical protein